jgi:hypothetical protein
MKRRGLVFLGMVLLNVLVSAAVTLGLLAWRDRRIAERLGAQATLPPARYSNFEIAAVIGPGVLETEYVLLRYVGDEPIDLTGWVLSDDSGHTFQFPPLTLFPNGALEIHTAAGEDTPIALHWGREEPLWRSGKQVLLFNPQGVLHASYLIP